jgi:hypothetical protein
VAKILNEVPLLSKDDRANSFFGQLDSENDYLEDFLKSILKRAEFVCDELVEFLDVRAHVSRKDYLDIFQDRSSIGK